jgi:peptidoglycan/xylan/chitin deacetylase (PgdA/CDA1 family)
MGAALERHLEHHVRLWTGLPPDARADVPRPPDELVRRLLRIEEYERDHRDEWGNFEFGMAEANRAGRLWVPELDLWLADRRAELARDAELVPLWPDGRRFAVCVTHDVDMVSRAVTPAQALRGVRAALRPMPEGRGEGASDRVLRVARAAARPAYHGVARVPPCGPTLERCAAIELELGVTGSYLFTVLPDDPTPYDCVYALEDPCEFRGRRTTVAEVTRELAADGFDVGLHGSYASALDARILSAERERLAAATGGPVTTTRQHYLHFDVRRTPRVQAESGLRTDSTLGFNRNIGFRAGTSLPFRLFDAERESEVDVLEVPLVIQEAPLVASNALDLGADGARTAVTGVIDSVAEAGGVATVLFHPHSLLDPGQLELYRHVIEHGLASGAWVASLAEIDAWWRERERRLAPVAEAGRAP